MDRRDRKSTSRLIRCKSSIIASRPIQDARHPGQSSPNVPKPRKGRRAIDPIGPTPSVAWSARSSGNDQSVTWEAPEVLTERDAGFPRIESVLAPVTSPSIDPVTWTSPRDAPESSTLAVSNGTSGARNFDSPETSSVSRFPLPARLT